MRAHPSVLMSPLRTLAIATGAVLILWSSANAQSFHDCEARPGEYIVKYRDGGIRALSTKVAAQSVVRGALSGGTVRIFSNISPDLEFMRGKKTKEEVKRLLKDPKVANAVEFIQPNCLYRTSDFSVYGTLRDPAKNTNSYPLSLVAPATDTADRNPVLNIFSPQLGLQSQGLSTSVRRSNGSVTHENFYPKDLKVGQHPASKDGLNDLVVFGDQELPDPSGSGYESFPGIKILSNKGNGKFEDDGLHLLSSDRFDNISDVTTALIDGDAHEDFVVGLTNWDRGKIAVVSPTEDDSFTSTFIDTTGKVLSIQAADVSGDGLSDIVALVRNSALGTHFNVFVNRGNTRFAPVSSLTIPDEVGSGYQIRVRDINGDGHNDLVLLTGLSLAWRLNLGNGTFGSYQTYEFYTTYGENTFLYGDEFEIVDVNGDSSPDAIVLGSYDSDRSDFLNPSPPSVTLIKNTSGVFGGAHAFLAGDATDSYRYKDRLFVKDVNGDERPDVAIAREEFNVVKVLLNNASTNPSYLAQLTTDQTYDQMLDSEPGRGVFLDPFALAQAPVSLSRGGKTYWAKTDTEGHFSFHGLPAGTYTTRVHLAGYTFPTLDGATLTITQNGLIPPQYGKRMPPAPPPPPQSRVVNATNDYAFNSLWGHNNYGQQGGVTDIDIDVPEAWSVSKGDGVVVGVIDTGLDVEHPDIADNVFINKGEIPNNGRDDDGNGYIDDARGLNPFGGVPDPVDDDSHGTGVASIIAARGNNGDGIVGVAPHAKVLAVKASPDQTFDLRAILAGADYFIKAKRNGVNIRVVNASYGGTHACTAAELAYVSALHTNNILFVAAAGNESANNDATPSSPANCETPSLLSVASVTRIGTLSGFSNFGKTTVDVAAPGSEILLLSPEAGYKVSSGTSMAAPYVSGVAALLFAKNPNLTATQAKQIIMSTAKPLASLKGKMVAPGVVSAARSLGVVPAGPPVGTTGKTVSYSTSRVIAKKKVSFKITTSEPLSAQSLGCFKGSVAPRKRSQSVSVKIQGATVSFQLVETRGKKTSIVPWPSKGTLTVTMRGNCASAKNGSLLDTDRNNTAGGPSRTLRLKIGG